MSSEQNKRYKLRVILTGDCGVGKTTLAERFYLSENYCKDSLKNCVRNVKPFFEKDMEINDDIVTLRVTDTVGQERYRSLTSSFYRNIQCCFLVFDTANKASMLNVRVWYDDLQHNTYDINALTTILVGTTKNSRKREVTSEQCEKYAEYLGLPYLEINLDNTSEVVYMFQIIANSSLQKYKCRMSSSSFLTCCNMCSENSLTISKIINKVQYCSC